MNHEPNAFDSPEPTPQPRALPCATPHSAPVAWLRSPEDAEPPEGEASDPLAAPPALSDSELHSLAAIAVSDPQALADAIAAACPEGVRRDGWTPFSRRLFLQVLAETGRVGTACAYTGLTRQSAYALRARDPVFAAGWDAACELARAPLADALYEKAIDGVTETLVRGGEVVATRHRHDSRLSIAVLSRLDRRCDRAEERGSAHLELVRRWDEWLGLIGKGEDDAALVMLEAAGGTSAKQCQSCQLAESANPTGPAEQGVGEHDEGDGRDRCWREGSRVWMTDFPPPPDFDGWSSGEWGAPGYERTCTDEEAELLEAADAPSNPDGLADAEELRDSWFARLQEGLDAADEGAEAK